MKPSVLNTAVHNFMASARRLSLEDDFVEQLREPKERIEVSVSPKLSDGSFLHVKCFMVRHSDALGPGKGGIRCSPEVDLDDTNGLAMEMTWKTALARVPFGGAKSGIAADPSKLSAESKECVIRSFTRAMRRNIGPELYIPAPDMGTNEVDMGHIRDCISYSAGVSITPGCFVTGKPLILGGIAGRREATGRGVVFSTVAACKARGIPLEGSRIVIEGFGNVGSVAALHLHQLGATVIGVCDIDVGLYNPKGIDIPDLIQHTQATGSLKGYSGAEEIPSHDVLYLECDILIPAACENQITGDNADRIRASLVAEAANGPTTPEGDEILNDRDIFVIPDIACNAGGVFVSYLEYIQETQREQMTEQQVVSRLSSRMQKIFDSVYGYSSDKGVTMREAAMDLAVQRVLHATKARGFLP